MSAPASTQVPPAAVTAEKQLQDQLSKALERIEQLEKSRLQEPLPATPSQVSQVPGKAVKPPSKPNANGVEEEPITTPLGNKVS